jgi:hypothetical protein
MAISDTDKCNLFLDIPYETFSPNKIVNTDTEQAVKTNLDMLEFEVGSNHYIPELNLTRCKKPTKK